MTRREQMARCTLALDFEFPCQDCFALRVEIGQPGTELRMFPQILSKNIKCWRALLRKQNSMQCGLQILPCPRRRSGTEEPETHREAAERNSH